MIEIQCIADIERLRESVDLECKLAAGRDGNGAVPEDFWPTYSAFANTAGGVVLLGMREKAGKFHVEGIANPAKVRRELFDTLNNRNKVSVNLLTDAQVQEIPLDGHTIFAIEVPRAGRKQRPVHLTTNPLAGHTYRRLNEGDRVLADEDVRRMIAEQVTDSRDTQILPGYGLAELALDSLHAYRNHFAAFRTGHPWTDLDDVAFLRKVGAWRHDAARKEDGLTLAGLLMFGNSSDIEGVFSSYFLDYQEQPEDGSETRWLDRVVPDGTWSGNLYDFYRKVLRKLTEDLKVPFVLKGQVRQDETPVHHALREALINALVHADYSDRAAVKVVKSPQGFLFRNPGLMRVPPEQALLGGESDCRNGILHKLFLLIGLGERAGSGLPKIRQGWIGEIKLTDSMDPYNQTRLELLWPSELKTGSRTGQGSPTVAEKMSGKMSGKTSGKILGALKENRDLTIPELAGLYGVTERSIQRNLQQLQRAGKLRRVGPDKGGHWEVLG